MFACSGIIEFDEFKEWFVRMGGQKQAPLGPARSVLKLGLALKGTFTHLFQVDIRRLARRRIVAQRRGDMVLLERGLYRQREPPYHRVVHTSAPKFACPTCLRGFTSAGFLARHVDRGTCTLFDTLTLGMREESTANAIAAAVSGIKPRHRASEGKSNIDDDSNVEDESNIESESKNEEAEDLT